jgi:hypothetical protein
VAEQFQQLLKSPLPWLVLGIALGIMGTFRKNKL